MSEPCASGRLGALTCDHVDVVRDGRLVLRDICLSARAEECVTFIGPNGSGKTTLLLTLLGLLRPARGAVRRAGRDVATLPARERGRWAAYLPQVLDASTRLSLRDVVRGGRYPHVGPVGRFTSQDHTAVRDALERCGLVHLAERPFDSVSGGERQKALLAAAIAQEPRVLFLDEPATALDPAYQLELVDILRGWRSAGRGLVLVSHDLQLPAALGGRVIALRDGRLCADGPAEVVLQPSSLGEIYAARFEVLATPDGQQLTLPAWWTGTPDRAR